MSPCVTGNLSFIFSDVMWLKGMGTKKKKKKRNHKGVAGDFLVSSLFMCMFGMQPSQNLQLVLWRLLKLHFSLGKKRVNQTIILYLAPCFIEHFLPAAEFQTLTRFVMWKPALWHVPDVSGFTRIKHWHWVQIKMVNIRKHTSLLAPIWIWWYRWWGHRHDICQEVDLTD